MQPNNCFADGFFILHATSACLPLFYDLPLPLFITFINGGYVFSHVGLTVCLSVF